ncbi:Dyp-type peroxidase [Pelistega ratti]|uniref:Dyp-type peroxidase n=1 Tax=Pelistega ratti TaxID=2652177 RepID=UPI001356D9A1|nr:Dyp-type peroxidase [Pelistega ratti]
MATPQSGIIPDHTKSGIFIEADFQTKDLDTIKQACIQSLKALHDLQQQYPEAVLGLTIAFGDQAWKAFNHPEEGKELKPFRPLGNGLAPATQHDLLIHIQSMRQDVSFALALDVIEIFGDRITVADETHGFRWVEERGLDGFIDGTENPQGEEKITQVGIIDQDQVDAGGSYVLIQKYLHDLKKWNNIPIQNQEASVGRSKKENIEFAKEVRLPSSHLGRVNIKEDGKGLKIVRRSLPFGTASGEHGLLFCAYCARLYNIEAQLLNMFGETDGKVDLLLTHLSQAISGAYYFAPSLERLQNL